MFSQKYLFLRNRSTTKLIPKVKRLITIALTILLSISASAQNDAYFCTRPGAVLRYERTEAGKNKLEYVRIQENKNYDAASGKVSFTNDMLKPNGESYFKAPLSMDATVSKDNIVTMDVGQSASSIVKSLMPDADIKATGGKSVLRSDMKPGDVLPDVNIVISAMGLEFKSTVTERKVVRFEKLKTKAGEFDCVVVREHKTEKGLGMNKVKINDTWYAKGVGMVRHDTYDKKMKLQTTELLTSIK